MAMDVDNVGFYLTPYLLYVSFGKDSAMQRELIIPLEPWKQ